nr:hypothetical protein [uncultured Cohaesibacter sp.]
MTIIRTPRRPSCLANVWTSGSYDGHADVDAQLVGCMLCGQEMSDDAVDDQALITFVTKTVCRRMAIGASVALLSYLPS